MFFGQNHWKSFLLSETAHGTRNMEEVYSFHDATYALPFSEKGFA
jgi:hypothetical protein